MHSPSPASGRRAFTLLELLIACTIIGVVAGIAAPRIRSALDTFAVEGARRDVVSALARARTAALRHGGAVVAIDTLSVTLTAAGSVQLARPILQAHGVRMRSSVGVIRYAATGLATGLSNGSIILARGAATDTVFVSRLGRVR